MLLNNFFLAIFQHPLRKWVRKTLLLNMMTRDKVSASVRGIPKGIALVLGFSGITPVTKEIKKVKKMFVAELSIANFRGFDENGVTLKPARGVNCIAGYNGVGKSTILAILGNCGELKKGDGCHLNGQSLRGEYSEIIKFDPTGDTSGQKAIFKFGKSFSDETLEAEELAFRAATQSYQKTRREYKSLGGSPERFEKIEKKISQPRYRLIPKKTKNRKTKTEKKLSWPVFYLGLSRLFPVGESAEVDQKKIKLPDEYANEFYDAYLEILGLDLEINDLDTLTPSEAPRKRGAAINTRNYGALANSAGQDNLGQIILTFLSFKKLKVERGEDYNGGLILIDEIDATLHPSAQSRLLSRMIKWAKEACLQVFFTTHSMHLVRETLQKVGNSGKNDFTRVIYITKSYGNLEVYKNPSFEAISNDVEATIANRTISPLEVPVLTEDDVARDFLKYIIKRSGKVFGLRYSEAHISYMEMAKLISGFPSFFMKALILFDPDASLPENRKMIEQNHLKPPFVLDGAAHDPKFKHRKVLFLPGDKPIEMLLWDHFSSKGHDDPFFARDICRQMSINKNSFIVQAKEQISRASGGKEFAKQWYSEFVKPYCLDEAFEDYCSAHESAVQEFVEKFEAEYNDALSMVKLDL